MPITYENGLPAVDIAGEKRILGALPPTLAEKMRFKRMRDVNAILPREQWEERDFRHLGSPVLNQHNHAACTNYAGVTCMDIARRHCGYPNVELSRTFNYAQINGGVDGGASLSAMLTQLKEVGAAPAEIVGPNQIFKHQIPQEAYAAAGNYKIQEAFSCRTFDEIGTALTRNCLVAIGILVGQNFGRLDKDGVAPLPVSTAGGHAMAIVGMKRVGRDWFLLAQNSWGKAFGFDGFCYLHETHLQRLLDAFAIFLPKESPARGDDEPPQVKLAEQAPVLVLGTQTTAESESPSTPIKTEPPAAESISAPPSEVEATPADSPPPAVTPAASSEPKAPSLSELLRKQQDNVRNRKHRR